MKRLRRCLGVPAILLLASSTTPSRAQESSGFAVDRFDPAERGSEWFVLESLDLRGEARAAAGVVGDWGSKPLVLYGANGSPQKRIIADQVFVHLGLAIVLVDHFRISANLPWALHQGGETAAFGGATYGAPSGSALGDLRIGADIRLVGAFGDPFTAAFGVQFHVPTGSQSDYTSDGEVRVAPRLLAAGDLGSFAYAMKLGLQFRALTDTFADTPMGSEFVAGGAAGFRAADRRLLVGAELYASTVIANTDAILDKKTTPFEALFGLHYMLVDELRIGAGIGPGLTRGLGTPQMRLVASCEWVPALSKPASPPPDRDQDGIADRDDACPDVPGVKTEDPKTNGCPPAASDRDGDGISDSDDACPDTPGVKTEDPKTNGCPPLAPDRDNDGISDRDDACPDTPGVKTDEPETNGCPPPPSDRDKDGIVDSEDACPDAPGSKNEDPKKNGCPEARIEAGEIKIIEQIKFRTGSTQILPESDSILTAVAKILSDNPEIKVRVEGHTDNRGSAAMNMALSSRRAASVVSWLVKHGIEPQRLTSKGHGLSRPVASNATEAGRQNNRRVEFHIDPGEETTKGGGEGR